MEDNNQYEKLKNLYSCFIDKINNNEKQMYEMLNTIIKSYINNLVSENHDVIYVYSDNERTHLMMSKSNIPDMIRSIFEFLLIEGHYDIVEQSLMSINDIVSNAQGMSDSLSKAINITRYGDKG